MFILDALNRAIQLPQQLDNIHIAGIVIVLTTYMVLVRYLRYKRKASIEEPYFGGKKSLSEMTVTEAHEVINQLQQLEFPSAFAKARRIALLKAGGIPTMSKLFAVTGQNTKRNAGRRAVDTEILLREAQNNARGSERYAQAVARMNYLHARYRRAGKITDDDLLHTLGDGLAEILTVVERDEWRALTDVEKCAVGLFHRNLGEDMGISFEALPSCQAGWRDGMHFAVELRDWTVAYEEEVAKPTKTNDQYVRVYVDSAVASLPRFVGATLRKVLGADLDDVMRTSLCIEKPGMLLSAFIWFTRALSKLFVRHLCLPRPSFLAVKPVHDAPNPDTHLFNFEQKTLQPWYVRPTFWSMWGPQALMLRALGGRIPGSRGDRYMPGGYDLKTIGPEPQKGRGLEEMELDVKAIMAKGLVTCPFSKTQL